MFTNKRITRATVKSFINKHKDKLQIKVGSTFDGMTDSVERVQDEFSAVKFGANHVDNTLGMHGAWFVGSSRDHLSAYTAGGMTGISVYNCCGSFIIAIPA